jgi:lysophospholipid acyltransferase (LPLAT)-like uncharacterized protein
VKKILISWRRALFLNVLYTVYRLLKCTWRIELDFDSEVEKIYADKNVCKVFAFFHEDEWALIPVFEHKKMNVLVSMSKDGSLMAALLRRLGYIIARGSSSKGAVSGLLALIRQIRSSNTNLVSIAVDGPKGPRRRAKNGVFMISDTLNAQLIVLGVYSPRAWVFKKSWSKAFIPKPFSKIRVSGSSFLNSEEVRKMVKRKDLAELAFELEGAIRAAKERSKRLSLEL